MEEPDTIAKQRFLVSNLARIAGLAVVLTGIAMARDAIAGPEWLGMVLAATGVGAFFFGPPLLVKRWKATDEDPQ